MTAPTQDERQPETLDERLDRLFGPSDPATDAWIEASLRIGSAYYGFDRDGALAVAR